LFDPIANLWVLVSAVLVFFMTFGLAIYEAGLVRSKNAMNSIMKNFVALTIMSIAFFGLGFGLAFGNDVYGIIGNPFTVDWYGLWHGTNLSTLTFFMFQLMFAAITLAILSAGAVERMKFSVWLGYSVIYSTLLWSIPAHWVWGGGWLQQLGIVDFAGGVVVHVAAGAGALAAMLILKPAERNRFYVSGSERYVHDPKAIFLGGAILWLGWFGFNGGSALALNDIAVLAVVNTNLAAAAGSVVAMFLFWGLEGFADLPMSVNGFLAGLVAVTPSAGFISPISAIVIGIASGIIVYFGTKAVWRLKAIDDPVGVVPCHGFNGIFGTLAVGLFAEQKFAGFNGLFFGGSIVHLLVQLLGIISVALLIFVSTLSILKLFDKFVGGARVSLEEESVGLDFSEHGRLP